MTLYTFENFGAKDGTTVVDAIAENNLRAINAAILWSAMYRQPVYGPNKTFRIKPEAGATLALVLVSGAYVICSDGCTIRRDSFTTMDTGMLWSAGARIASAKWIGGRFLTTKDGMDRYFKGDVLSLFGDDLLLQDIVIDGYREGRAMLLRGNRIQVVRPRVKNPDMLGAAGLRFTGGEGFRCYDGDVVAGDDAAYQFSTQENSGPIIDGAYIGCRGKSLKGRLLLVGTKFDEIRNVRFQGISGEVEMDGQCIKVQNVTRGTDSQGMPVAQAPVSDVLFSDIEVSTSLSAMPAPSVVVENELNAGPMTNIRFEALFIRSPRNIAFQVKGGPSGIAGLEWRGGGVYPPSPGVAAITLAGLTNGIFEAIEIPSGLHQNIPSLVVVGDGAGTGICTNVVFTDAVVKGIASGRVGVEFKYAVNCGWSRGSIAGAPGAKAVSIDAVNAVACYVEGANLSGIPTTTVAKIDAPSSGGHRIANNFGSDQRTGLGLGVKTGATILNGSITVTSTAVDVSTGGASSAALHTINGGQAGDVLVLATVSASQVVNLQDGVGNLRLAGTCPLNNPDDTITLIKTSASIWLELSRSDNA